jgi:DnaJ-class molecular chaperone
MTHIHPEAIEYAEHTYELVAMAGNLIECQECGGTGETVSSMCAGGRPIFIRHWCQACDGSGKVLP